MTINRLYLALPLAAMLALCVSCKGRHADGTPTGDTVEVTFAAEEQAATLRADSTAAAQEDAATTDTASKDYKAPEEDSQDQ